jgi:hypothetical protein
MNLVDFEFEGATYQVDADAFKDYRVAKWIALSAENPACAFKAFERIFDGRDEEYADALGGDAEKMGELMQSALIHVAELKDGETVKN